MVVEGRTLQHTPPDQKLSIADVSFLFERSARAVFLHHSASDCLGCGLRVHRMDLSDANCSSTTLYHCAFTIRTCKNTPFRGKNSKNHCSKISNNPRLSSWAPKCVVVFSFTG